jgi:hypothetical protein
MANKEVLPAAPRSVTHELIYPTTLKVRGPWLLETDCLLALDEILETFCARDDPEWRNSPPQSGKPLGVPRNLMRSRKELTIFLSKDRACRSSGFKESMSNINFQDDVAKGFEYVATTRTATVTVRLPKKPEKEGNEEKWFLAIDVTPERPETGHEIFMDLRNWADSVKSPLLYQWMLFAPRFLYQFTLGILLLVVLANALNPAPTAADYKATLKQEARDLLRNGINQQNQTKALELVLALESDYIPPGTKAQKRRWPSGWYLIAIYVFGFLSFTPSICVGVWAGKGRLRLWKRWLQFNTYTIPVLLFAHYIQPQFFSILDSLRR